ncbi:hypothetical protein [Cryobacterium fucosi]|uniref:Integral membrane protein n=1 Tax=Cryobacterium fucosi TaxID=1259157 RepID=A0A4R9B8V4_9MICO|nr:hypothetical protein [Cryobacterium fucosi]TFD76902.1 hypothetical protein E3T48_09110 [Cryobacterium fucosi]
MNMFEILRLIALVAHFLGLATVIGPFLAQLRRREGFHLGLMHAGAITQLVSGGVLIAARLAQHLAVIEFKMVAKILIAAIVLVALIIAMVIQRRRRTSGVTDADARPWFLAAGSLAVVNVIVATAWT